MINPPRSMAKGRSPIGGQRQLQTLVRLQAARSTHGPTCNQQPTALRFTSDRQVLPGGAVPPPQPLYIEAVTSRSGHRTFMARSERGTIKTLPAFAPCRSPSSHTPAISACGLTVMRFSCAPPERGGQRNKSNKHVLSIPKDQSAQHGQRPVADRQQRQLQTLVRPRDFFPTT
jgi:hypothetical protein